MERRSDTRFRSGRLVNPHGLMFHGLEGGPISGSNLTRSVMNPARIAAGWPGERKLLPPDDRRFDPQGPDEQWEYRFRWSLHSLRHRFCSIALLPKAQGGFGLDVATVAVLAGHSDPMFTLRRYVGAASDVIPATAAAYNAMDWAAWASRDRPR